MNKSELEKLRDINVLFMRFLMNNTDLPATALNAVLQSFENSYKEKDLRALKAGERDMYEQIKEMPTPLMLKLKAELKEKLNIDSEVFEKIQSKKIAQIIKRNKIKNDDEYGLILNRVEEIYSDSSKHEEISMLNEMLSSYYGRL